MAEQLYSSFQRPFEWFHYRCHPLLWAVLMGQAKVSVHTQKILGCLFHHSILVLISVSDNDLGYYFLRRYDQKF